MKRIYRSIGILISALILTSLEYYFLTHGYLFWALFIPVVYLADILENVTRIPKP